MYNKWNCTCRIWTEISTADPFLAAILRYHHRTVALDNTRLVKLAMLSGCALSDDQAITATTNKSWHFHLGCFVEHYTGQQQLWRSFDIGVIIEQAKHWIAFKYFQDSSLLLYRTEIERLCSLSTNTLTIFLL